MLDWPSFEIVVPLVTGPPVSPGRSVSILALLDDMHVSHGRVSEHGEFLGNAPPRSSRFESTFFASSTYTRLAGESASHHLDSTIRSNTDPPGLDLVGMP